jgi:hypothetical protein
MANVECRRSESERAETSETLNLPVLLDEGCKKLLILEGSIAICSVAHELLVLGCSTDNSRKKKEGHSRREEESAEVNSEPRKGEGLTRR